jgi:hypothetical protein
VGTTHQSARHSMNERALVPWCAMLRVCASIVIGCTVRMAAPCTTPHHTTHHSSAQPNFIMDLCESHLLESGKGKNGARQTTTHQGHVTRRHVAVARSFRKHRGRARTSASADTPPQAATFISTLRWEAKAGAGRFLVKRSAGRYSDGLYSSDT